MPLPESPHGLKTVEAECTLVLKKSEKTGFLNHDEGLQQLGGP
jgi:hypothetical protein